MGPPPNIGFEVRAAHQDETALTPGPFLSISDKDLNVEGGYFHFKRKGRSLIPIQNHGKVHGAVNAEGSPLEIADMLLLRKIPPEDVEEDPRKLQVGAVPDDEKIQLPVRQAGFVEDIAEACYLRACGKAEHDTPHLMQDPVYGNLEIIRTESCGLGGSLEVVSKLLDVLLGMGRGLIGGWHEIPSGAAAEEIMGAIHQAHIQLQGLPLQGDPGRVHDVPGQAHAVGQVVAGPRREDADGQEDPVADQEADYRADGAIPP